MSLLVTCHYPPSLIFVINDEAYLSRAKGRLLVSVYTGKSLSPYLIYYDRKKFYGTCSRGPHSQHFFFFAIYKWPEQDRVLHYTRRERLVRDKHSSLLAPFVSYEENEVSQASNVIKIFSVTYDYLK